MLGEQVYVLKKKDRKPFEVVKDKVIFEFVASKVAGDSVYFSSSIPHRWKNLGTEVMKAIWIITPPTF